MKVKSLVVLAASSLLAGKFLPVEEVVPLVPSNRPVPLINSPVTMAESFPLLSGTINLWFLVRWWKVENYEILTDLVDSIQKQLPIIYYYPRLLELLGPDNHE